MSISRDRQVEENVVFYDLVMEFVQHHFYYLLLIFIKAGLPWWLSSKESTCQCQRHGFHPWVRKIPWRRKWQSTPIFLSGEFHGLRNGELQYKGSQKTQTRLNDNKQYIGPSHKIPSIQRRSKGLPLQEWKYFYSQFLDFTCHSCRNYISS